MRLLVVIGAVTWIPVAAHGALDHWGLALGLIASIIVSAGIIHRKVLRPCWAFCKGLFDEFADMKETIDTVPGQFDGVHERLRAGDDRMEVIEKLGLERSEKLERMNLELQAIANADAQLTRTAIAASAARHVAIAVPTDEEQRLFFRE